MKIPTLVLSLTLMLGMSACTTTGPGMMGGTEGIDNSSVRAGYGTVESVDRVERSSSGVLGTVGGALVGGLLGHQIGSGSGNTAATIAGAAGGAYAGREIERRTRGGEESYRIVVRMDDGSYQSVAQDSAPVVRRGDRIRIQNGNVIPI